MRYVNGLKRRIKHLEELQQAKRLRRPTPQSPGATEGNTLPLRDRAQTRLSQSLAKVPEFGQLALSTISADVNYSQKTSARQLSMVQLIDAALATNEDSQAGEHDRDLRQAQDALRKQCTANTATPPNIAPDVGSALMRMYVRGILTRLPFIDSSILMQSFEYVIAEDGRGAKRQPRQTFQFVLVYLAISTVAAAAGTTIEMAQLAARLHGEATKLLPFALTRGESLEAVQCLTSFTIYGLYSSQGGSIWHLLGIAITKAVSLGLHRLEEVSNGSAMSQRSDSKRLFWVLYLLDRDVSAALGKPVTIDKYDISTSKPAREETRADIIAEDLELLAELVEHTHLSQEIQSDIAKPDIYFTTILYSWRQGSSVDKLQTRDEQMRELGLRLQCRILVSLYHQRLLAPPTLMHGLEPSGSQLFSETLTTSRAWLQCLDRQCISGQHYASALDAYEVAKVGIVSTMIVRRQDGMASAHETHAAAEIHVLSMSLLSFFSARHDCARELRWTLSTTHNAPSYAGFRDGLVDNTLKDRQTMRDINGQTLVPRSLRQLCQQACDPVLHG